MKEKMQGLRGVSLVKPLWIVSTAFAVTTASIVNAAVDEGAIKSRIAPIGQVCVEGEACAGQASTSDSVDAGTDASAARSGEDIFNTYCTACHTSGVAGAPIKGNKEQWAPRIANGLDQLVQNAVNGINAMPAKGTCMDCSEDEIKTTVEYMVDASR